MTTIATITRRQRRNTIPVEQHPKLAAIAALEHRLAQTRADLDQAFCIDVTPTRLRRLLNRITLAARNLLVAGDA